LKDVNEKSATVGHCELIKHKYARILKLNTNAIESIEEVANLNYLLEIQAKANQIKDISFMAQNAEVLPHLQKLDLTTNKLTSLPNIKCPALFSLILDENEIS
jgi:Leucine-rich repeat (LRR) protein